MIVSAPFTHLFVYGTLMPDACGELGLAERARLAVEADLLGPATTTGLLLDLGDYPGLIDGPGVVHGIVYALRNPAATLAWLDAYEDVRGTSQDLYRRDERPVTLETGTSISAWTYVSIQPMIERAVIGSGRWYLRSPNHAAT